ncbi:MAG: hypothetical protein AAFQ50_06360, partial [Pseudomonadota bacterium]
MIRPFDVNAGPIHTIAEMLATTGRALRPAGHLCYNRPNAARTSIVPWLNVPWRKNPLWRSAR